MPKTKQKKVAGGMQSEVQLASLRKQARVLELRVQKFELFVEEREVAERSAAACSAVASVAKDLALFKASMADEETAEKLLGYYFDGKWNFENFIVTASKEIFETGLGCSEQEAVQRAHAFRERLREDLGEFLSNVNEGDLMRANHLRKKLHDKVRALVLMNTFFDPVTKRKERMRYFGKVFLSKDSNYSERYNFAKRALKYSPEERQGNNSENLFANGVFLSKRITPLLGIIRGCEKKAAHVYELESKVSEELAELGYEEPHEWSGVPEEEVQLLRTELGNKRKELEKLVVGIVSVSGRSGEQASELTGDESALNKFIAFWNAYPEHPSANENIAEAYELLGDYYVSEERFTTALEAYRISDAAFSREPDYHLEHEERLSEKLSRAKGEKLAVQELDNAGFIVTLNKSLAEHGAAGSPGIARMGDPSKILLRIRKHGPEDEDEEETEDEALPQKKSNKRDEDDPSFA